MMSKEPPTTTQLTPVLPLVTSGLTSQELEQLLESDQILSWDVQRLPLTTTRYQLGKVIASGGMGKLYEGLDRVLGRKVAIKVLERNRLDEDVTVMRFLQEARIHGQLRHPGVPPLHDLGRLAEDMPFIAMGYIRGRTLNDLTGESRKSVPVEKLLVAFQQICDTMAYAHSKGVIHRDLTPKNIIISSRGPAQVIDWGLARVLRNTQTVGPTTTEEDTALVNIDQLGLTDNYHALGTPAYMAPEQADGRASSAIETTDVFGLGGILCFILTGHPPYSGRKASDLISQARSGDMSKAFERLDECEAEDDLIQLAKSCLSPVAKDRPIEVTEIAQVVEAVCARGSRQNRPWWKRLFQG